MVVSCTRLADDEQALLDSRKRLRGGEAPEPMSLDALAQLNRKKPATGRAQASAANRRANLREAQEQRRCEHDAEDWLLSLGVVDELKPCDAARGSMRCVSSK
jgi:hypothetical protein